MTEISALALADAFKSNYQQLRQIAHARLRKGAALTLLDTSGLVHEVFAKLGKSAPVIFDSDQHFLAYTSTVMRSLIVDTARARHAERRGGGRADVTLNTALAIELPAELEGLLDIDAALNELECIEPRIAQVVNMRFFGGFTEAEIAATLGVSLRSVKRDWEKARMLLAAMLD